MHANVAENITKKMELVVPIDLFVRFVKSLGFAIEEDTYVSVWQSSASGGNNLIVSWTETSQEKTYTIQGIDEEDIEVVAGIVNASSSF